MSNLARLPQHAIISGPCQEAQHRPLEALHRHGHRPLDVVQRRHVAPAGELQERAQRRQPQVAAANRVVPLALQVVQELPGSTRA
jgi:hypothetical protein